MVIFRLKRRQEQLVLTLRSNPQKIELDRVAESTGVCRDLFRFWGIFMLRFLRYLSSPVLGRIIVVFVAMVVLFSFAVQPNDKVVYVAAAPALQGDLADRASDDLEGFSQYLTNPLSSNDMAVAQGLGGSVSIAEWLGPLAPIAISPFFGITLLAGISQFGSESLPFNQFISNNPILSNPATFWIFLGLTLLTSLPRFTKVSKPAAQAIDQLETYAAIITIVLLRVLASTGEAAGAEEMGPIVMQAGIFSFSADVLMSIAAIVNIIVINTIKFLFEVSVWLIPFPMVDAALEVANKSACAALMGVYAYNPTLATIINLLIFVACLFAFNWAKRRTGYLRTLLLDPIWTMISPGYAVPKNSLTVFPQQAFGPFKSKTRLIMQATDEGWTLTRHRFLRTPKTVSLTPAAGSLAVARGLIANRIQTGDGNCLLFSRRHSSHLPQLADQLNLEMGEEMTTVEPAIV
jgi:hypothetical protein